MRRYDDVDTRRHVDEITRLEADRESLIVADDAIRVLQKRFKEQKSITDQLMRQRDELNANITRWRDARDEAQTLIDTNQDKWTGYQKRSDWSSIKAHF